MIKTWKGERLVYYFDDKCNSGIIIENNRVYEGEIEKGKSYGHGAEYFSLGLTYTIYERE